VEGGGVVSGMRKVEGLAAKILQKKLGRWGREGPLRSASGEGSKDVAH